MTLAVVLLKRKLREAWSKCRSDGETSISLKILIILLRTYQSKNIVTLHCKYHFLQFLDGINDTLFGRRTDGVFTIVHITHGPGKDLRMDGSDISCGILVQESIATDGH